MNINEFMDLITNVCFPVAVCSYLLVRLEKQVQSLTSSVNKLNNIISVTLGTAIDIDSLNNSDNAA